MSKTDVFLLDSCMIACIAVMGICIFLITITAFTVPETIQNEWALGYEGLLILASTAGVSGTMVIKKRAISPRREEASCPYCHEEISRCDACGRKIHVGSEIYHTMLSDYTREYAHFCNTGTHEVKLVALSAERKRAKLAERQSVATSRMGN